MGQSTQPSVEDGAAPSVRDAAESVDASTEPTPTVDGAVEPPESDTGAPVPQDAGQDAATAGDPDGAPADASVDSATPGTDAGVGDDAGDLDDSGATDAGEQDATLVDATVDAEPDSGPEPEPTCPETGRYAMEIDARVTWETKTILGFVPIIRGGEGSIKVNVLFDMATDGPDLSGDIQVCDAQVPDFQSSNIAGNELYSVYFEPEVWEGADMPRTPFSATVGCDEPGCVMRVDPLQVVLGVEMEDRMAPWPEERLDMNYMDHDGDGEPGITLSFRGPNHEPVGTFSYAPVALNMRNRTRNIHLGLRVRTHLAGELTSCDAVEGIVREFALDTHAADCSLEQRGEGTCSNSEAQFIDNNLPNWTTRDATFQAKRVADDAGCDVARAVFAEPTEG